MALLYIDEADASLNRADVASGETIYEGEFIELDSSGDATRFDPANDDLPHGIVVHHPGGDSIVEHDEDYVNYSDLWKYNGNDGDRLYYQPLASVDNVMPRTLTDNGTDPAPTVDEGTIMGIVTINTQTEIVEQGYTDDSSTTYNESNNNFVALGRVDKQPTELKLGDAFNLRVPIRLDTDVFQP